MSAPKPLRVELASVGVLPDGFVLGVFDADAREHRIEFPVWALHQLMRMLPRLDAARLQPCREPGSRLVAYPVESWGAQAVAAEDSVALSMRTDRGVESAYLFKRADARALHATLGEMLAAPASGHEVPPAAPTRSHRGANRSVKPRTAMQASQVRRR
jgi:hypothetical protein